MIKFEQFSFGLRYRNAHLSKIEQAPEVVNILMDWCAKPGGILYWNGNVGNGKTYFAAAYFNHLMDQKQELYCRVYSESYLFNELKLCMDIPSCPPSYRLKAICDTKYLILDDMGSSMMTDWQKEMLLALIETRMNNRLPTLITSNLSQKDLSQKFHPRFASRLYDSYNTVIETDGIDRRSLIRDDD